MKRTRKWAFVAQEATRLASLELSPLEIATRLGVNKSTITRWMATGKLTKTRASRPRRPVIPFRPGQTPPEWAQAVRGAYDLDATDEQLVTLAEAALLLSIDPAVAPQVRLAASGRFQALVRQLALVARTAEAGTDTPKPEVPAQRALARAVRPRSSLDPRSGLMAVK